MKSHDLLLLPPFDKKEKQWRVIIETPRRGHHKYKYEPALGGFTLHRILPEGMSFPYDFGFLPGTRGPDGDPLDVLMILKDPTFPGCIIPSRLVGVIEAEQTERDGQKVRNDRLIAIATESRDASDIKSIRDINPNLISEIEDFFSTYNRLFGKKFRVLGLRGPKTAQALAQEGVRHFPKKKVG